MTGPACLTSLAILRKVSVRTGQVRARLQAEIWHPAKPLAIWFPSVSQDPAQPHPSYSTSTLNFKALRFNRSLPLAHNELTHIGF